MTLIESERGDDDRGSPELSQPWPKGNPPLRHRERLTAPLAQQLIGPVGPVLESGPGQLEAHPTLAVAGLHGREDMGILERIELRLG